MIKGYSPLRRFLREQRAADFWLERAIASCCADCGYWLTTSTWTLGGDALCYRCGLLRVTFPPPPAGFFGTGIGELLDQNTEPAVVSSPGGAPMTNKVVHYAVGQRWKVTKDVGSSGIHKAGMIFTISSINDTDPLHGRFDECRDLACGSSSIHNFKRFVELGAAVRLCGWVELAPIIGTDGVSYDRAACMDFPAHDAAPFCEGHIAFAMAVKDHANVKLPGRDMATPQSHNLGAGIGIWNIRGR